MNKKLPGVFANKVKSNGNNEKVFYGQNDINDFEGDENVDVRKKIKDIFKSSDYVYKADVILKINGKFLTKRIVGMNKKHLITMDNELLPIEEISDIKRK
ncbi:MAG: hypothetical protein IKJ43_04365 [Bacilli bacterium]|nr:hypothetical protein [Bacilli bacterium]